MNNFGLFEMNRDLLKQIAIEQKELFLKKSFGVKRNELKNVKKLAALPHVVVITGLRRSGKSTFLRQIASEYYHDKNFYYLNFEDERFLKFSASNFNELYEVLISVSGSQKIFFLDEVQNVPDFQKFVRRFYDDGFKFYLTGSSADLLSKEIGTKLTGRHVDILISPFSFNEYLNYFSLNFNETDIYKTETRASIKREFDKFLFEGGMPEYLKYNEPDILRNTYDDIVIKDIAVRYGIYNVQELKELSQFLITNFASKFSFSKTKKTLGFGSVTTVKNYVNYFTDAYLFYSINKFDYSMKKQIVNEKKLYAVDNGFIRRVSMKLTKDFGRLLENYVANELRKFGAVYYFKQNGSECDFIIQRQNAIVEAIQVCYNFNEENESREIKGLTSAMEEFGLSKGLILTYDTEREIKSGKKKISLQPVWKWVLQK